MNATDLLFLVSVLNSFVFDASVRSRVAANVTLFYLQQVPVPRVVARQDILRIARRAARLICIAPEFDALACEVGLSGHNDGAIDDAGRARLRAEIDGFVAHLYGLTEEEFAHILGSFLLVPDPVKVAARNAYRDVAKGLLQ